ncbi:MAG: glycosyltransferase family 4 protein [Geminicoccaceae bacterium]|nr:glycosyltransferase family 4 protein [Geminicoccaceae bacterium]
MRIAFLTNNRLPPREGIGRHLFEVATRLQDRGHACMILCPGELRGWRRERLRNLDVLHFPYFKLRPFHHALLRPVLQRWLDDGADGADLLHVHLPLLPPLRSDLPRVVTFHTPMLTDTAAIPEKGVKPWLIKANARRFSAAYEQSHIDAATRLIAVSSTVAGELEGHYRLDGKPVEVIANGVDARFFPFVNGARRSRHVLYVGRLGYRKGLFRLLDALARLDDPRIRLELAGEGPLEGELRTRARRLGLAERVDFKGFLDRDRLREALKSAGCFVNPADYEGAPLTLLEAMAVGTPIVSTPAGAREFGPQAPFWTCSADAASLAATIMTALDQPATARDRAVAARDLVERHYDWEVVVDRLLATYGGEERRAA